MLDLIQLSIGFADSHKHTVKFTWRAQVVLKSEKTSLGSISNFNCCFIEILDEQLEDSIQLAELADSLSMSFNQVVYNLSDLEFDGVRSCVCLGDHV